jgi:ubiquinone/menaquinone biosynthesis C-methylase UbiE
MKLHLCCGKRDFGSDWIHIDMGDFPHVKYHDVTKLPFKDHSVDLIYCCHGIGYFDREEIIPVLIEWKRVLKSGGILRLATPDFYKIFQLSKRDSMRFISMIYGKWKVGDKFIYYKTGYDFFDLKDKLDFCGFNNINHYDWRKIEHSQFDDFSQAYIPHMDKDNGILISLNVQCKKP